jgi:hypothetical protein
VRVGPELFRVSYARQDFAALSGATAEESVPHHPVGPVEVTTRLHAVAKRWLRKKGAVSFARYDATMFEREWELTRKPSQCKGPQTLPVLSGEQEMALCDEGS